MKLDIKKPRDFINPLLSKKSVAQSKFEQFKIDFSTFKNEIDNQHAAKQTESNIVTNTLKPFIEALGYKCNSYSQNGQSGIDLAILSHISPAVIFESKKDSSNDMITPDKPNTKALQEAVLYFMRERDKGNQAIFHIVITDFYGWYIFDAKEFDRLFWADKTIHKLFNTFKNPSLLGSTTQSFYDALQREIEKLKKDLIEDESMACAFFNIRLSYSEKELLAIYKLLSPDSLLKEFDPNDANSLNREFYNELLYILGLEETKDEGKKVIRRAIATQYGTLYENIQNKLVQYGKHHDFEAIIKLIIIWINRILFLKLLESQIVKWTGDKDRKFLSFDKINEYDRLEELFFQVLALPLQRRTTKEFNYIPYLNSSLFEIHADEKLSITIAALSNAVQIDYYAKTVVKDANSKRKSGQVNTLRYLFEFLDSYDFGNNSNDELVSEQKNLINASVLGLIFEKINGYKDGSFYTPSFITMYMARETIQKSILDKFNQAYEGLEAKTWQELMRYCDKHSHKQEFLNTATPLIDSVTVCDPAVGSGHFLVSALNEIVFAKYELGIFRQKGVRLELVNDELLISLDDEWFEYTQPSSFASPNHLLQKALFEEKQRIIENQLFGVDINPNSSQITKLRLWIELLKHSYYGTDFQLVTLPNIDINIKTGDSLVSRFELTDDIKDKNIRAEIAKYKNKVKEYKENIGSKREVMSSIEGLKEQFNQTLKTGHKSVKGLNQKLLEYSQIFGFRGLSKELQTRSIDATHGQSDFFGADPSIADKNRSKNAEMIGKLSELLGRVKEFESGEIYHNAFEWRFEFPEILDDDGEFLGFDVVIANPPFIDSEKMVRDGHEAIRSHLSETYDCAKGNWDLYIVFMELGLSLLKDRGTMMYITPDKWIAKPFGDTFRMQYINGIEKVVKFGRDVFDSATVDSIITHISRLDTQIIKTEQLENGIFKPLHQVQKNELAAPYYLDSLLSLHYDFVRRLELIPGRVANIITCESACATSDAYKIKPLVIDASTYDRHNQYQIVNTGTLGKYVTRWGSKPMTYLKDKYLRPVVCRTEFAEAFRNSYKSKSDAKKIIVKGLTLLDAALDLHGSVIPGKTTLVLTSESDDTLKFVTAVLNCPISIFFIKAKYGSSSYNGGISFTKNMINSLPLPAFSGSETQLEVIKSVDEILIRKSIDPNANICDLERTINQSLYELYELTEDEITLVGAIDAGIKLSESEEGVQL